MAIGTATVTFDIADQLGTDFDPRRTKVWVTTNVPGDTIVDTSGNQIRLGSGNVTVNADGTGSVTVWTPGPDANPASWQTTIHVDYPDRNARGGRASRSFGPFTIITSADLADLVAEQEVPPTYLSLVTAQLDTKVDEASGYADAAAASAAQAQSVADIDTPDALVATLVPTSSGSATSAALSATYAAKSIEPTVAAIPTTYAPIAAGYPRRQRLRPRPQETVISTMGAGHGWTSSGAWSSVNLNDTTDQGWDNQVITAVTPGTGSGCFLAKTGLTPFDPTGTYFVVMVKAAVPSRIANLQMYVEDGSANKHLLNAFFNGGQLKPNEWLPVVFSFDGATVIGTGIGTAATQVSFRVADVNGSGGTTIKFGGLSRVAPSPTYPNGVVSFTFDDCWASHYTIARPVLNKYRYRATEYPILDQLGQSGRLTTQQLYDLSLLNGWEIGGHATTIAAHTTGLPAMTASARTAELRAIKGYMMSSGLQGDSLAYPGGNYDTATSNEVRAMFSAARTTDASPKETLPAADVTRLRSKSIGSTDTLASLQTLIDQAYTYKHHLIFTIHDIVASGASGSTQINTATLTGLVDYCATKGIPVRTIDEVTANV